MSAITGVIKELIVLSIVGMIYLTAFAPILTDAVTNYTGGGTVGTALGTVVGMLPLAVIAIIFVGLAMKSFGGKN
jgi:hypothetical protein